METEQRELRFSPTPEVPPSPAAEKPADAPAATLVPADEATQRLEQAGGVTAGMGGTLNSALLSFTNHTKEKAEAARKSTNLPATFEQLQATHPQLRTLTLTQKEKNLCASALKKMQEALQPATNTDRLADASERVEDILSTQVDLHSDEQAVMEKIRSALDASDAQDDVKKNADETTRRMTKEDHVDKITTSLGIMLDPNAASQDKQKASAEFYKSVFMLILLHLFQKNVKPDDEKKQDAPTQKNTDSSPPLDKTPDTEAQKSLRLKIGEREAYYKDEITQATKQRDDGQSKRNDLESQVRVLEEQLKTSSGNQEAKAKIQATMIKLTEELTVIKTTIDDAESRLKDLTAKRDAEITSLRAQLDASKTPEKEGKKNDATETKEPTPQDIARKAQKEMGNVLAKIVGNSPEAVRAKTSIMVTTKADGTYGVIVEIAQLQAALGGNTVRAERVLNILATLMPVMNAETHRRMATGLNARALDDLTKNMTLAFVDSNTLRKAA